MIATITGTGSGSAPVVNLTFPYIDKAHVSATVDGVNAPFSWTGTSQITFLSAVPAGSSWKVFRTTPTSPAIVDYTNGAVLTEANLDLAQTSHRYRDEELADQTTLTNVALTQEVSDRGAAITQEVADRNAAIAVEATNRTNAVNAEAATRAAATAAEAALRIAAVAGEAAARVAADASEKIDRINAINGLLAGLGGVSLTDATIPAVDRTMLAGLNHTLGLAAQLMEFGRAGLFVPKLIDLSANVAADPQQGMYVAFSSDPTGASGAWVRALEGPMLPEHFGALGDGATDDTAALNAIGKLVSFFGTGHVRFGFGMTYLLGNTGVDQETIRFQNVNGLVIEGWGSTLKTLASGCPVVLDGSNWGQINLDNCHNVDVLGFVLDGNRDEQLHTSGQPDAYGYNGGIVIWHNDNATFDASDIRIRFNHFKNHGTLTNSTDRRGDAIFSVSGLKRAWIEDNTFDSVGRWVFALAEGGLASSDIYFRRNVVRNDDRLVTGQYPWGVIDIEDVGLPHQDIFIEDNVLFGTAQLSLGGNNATALNVTVKNIHVRRNKWFTTSGNVIWQIGNGAPGTGTYRTFENLYVEDNIVEITGQGTTIHVGHTSKLRNAYIRRNTFRASVATVVGDGGFFIGFNGHIEGEIDFSDNHMIGMGEGLKNDNVWYADPSPQPLDFTIEGNRWDNCTRSMNLQFNASVIPVATSHVYWGHNRSRNSRSGSGEYIDMTAAGGTIPNQYWDSDRADPIWARIGVTLKP